MKIRILGPLEIADGDRRVSIGAPKQRALLAALILRANRVVPTAELAGYVWDDAPPSSARLTLQGYVLRLRRALEPLDGVAIVTEPAGYLLRADPGEVDACRFESLLAEADRHARTGDAAAEATLLREALGLWRGEPLADVESESLRREEAGRLPELWARAVGRRVEADLRLGRHGELIGELRALAAAHPLREEFRAQLMTALYRSGRRADALRVYQETRRTLVAELGVEPGPRLRRLERAVLVADPALDLEPEEENSPLRSPAVLPPDVPHFVGRETEAALLLAGEETATGPLVCAVAGMAGVGKTALVLHAAHRLGERYPDGRLYVDLGGTGEHPMEPDVALDRFLRLLGVWNGRIPVGTDERAALLRDRLAGRRVLLVLDNAVDEAQVRPLIPGTPGCAVLITSRARLVGLEYARLVDLDVLAAEHAVDLLAGVIGPERTGAEADCARTLVAQCGCLPLAVRIVAARLAGHPEWRLDRLTGQLADEHRRLDRLAAGDLEVRSSIALSHDALAPEHRRPFRLIGLLDLPEVAPWMIAALLDRPAGETEDIVDALVDARLLEAGRADTDGGYRYRCHDLVRLFARERALATDPPEEREAAVKRVMESLLAFARGADDALPSRRLRLPEASTGHAAPAAPLAWFEANRATLTVAVRQAAALGLAEPAWRLAATLVNFFDLRGYWDDWARTHRDALGAARACGDPRGETAMEYGLGILATVGDRYDDAAGHLSAALAGCRALEAPVAEARVLNALGDVHHICDRLDDAFACFQEALRLSTRHGDLTGAANSLLDLGLVHRDRNRPAESLDHLRRALATFRAAGDAYGEAYVLRFLAATHYHSRGDLVAARRHATHAIKLFRRLGDDLAEVRSLRLLAMVLAAQDHGKAAVRLLDRCLAVFRERGDRFGEASTLWSLGEAAQRSGDAGLAAEHLERALSLFGRLSVPRWEDRTRAELVAVRAGGAARPARAQITGSVRPPASSPGSG
ncbi:BTAD domain-containing putative transcriptional regulator [Actinomadura sp. DC4]|uniref:AfsR/SARP family transcriptional regulator n=1 Tax=Actinomadura sp. DC4 TaxID=3055069 RepID=UPI0025AFBFA4|nr:BTAD domain-containing putative transcriptional regulator [Actinomadura sp. DC4]MDN3353765.1 BTAD domain-containing putative transcriptional regulator [Actinomadura sp. DC4]